MKNTPDKTWVRIPHRELSDEALSGIIEQFIGRDGPDSGHVELSFDQKKKKVLRSLDTGSAVLVFDHKTNSCNIISKDDL